MDFIDLFTAKVVVNYWGANKAQVTEIISLNRDANYDLEKAIYKLAKRCGFICQPDNHVCFQISAAGGDMYIMFNDDDIIIGGAITKVK